MAMPQISPAERMTTHRGCRSVMAGAMCFCIFASDPLASTAAHPTGSCGTEKTKTRVNCPSISQVRHDVCLCLVECLVEPALLDLDDGAVGIGKTAAHKRHAPGRPGNAIKIVAREALAPMST